LSIIPSVILMGGHACRPTISNSMANARDLASAAIPSTIRHLISKLKILPACGMVADSKNVLWTSLWANHARAGAVPSHSIFIHRFRRPSKCLLQRSLEYPRLGDLKVFVDEGYDQCASVRGSELGAVLWLHAHL
jgi:hypothetical protein